MFVSILGILALVNLGRRFFGLGYFKLVYFGFGYFGFGFFRVEPPGIGYSREFFVLDVLKFHLRNKFAKYQTPSNTNKTEASSCVISWKYWYSSSRSVTSKCSPNIIVLSNYNYFFNFVSRRNVCRFMLFSHFNNFKYTVYLRSQSARLVFGVKVVFFDGFWPVGAPRKFHSWLWYIIHKLNFFH